jgi:hypothetical protein
MVRLIPIVNELSAVVFAKLFMHEVFPHYGFPLKLISDRGRQWNNDFFCASCEYAGIDLLMITAYHLQSNGLVERTNEVVESSL